MDRLRAGDGAGRDQSKLTRALHVGDGLEVLLRAISPEAAFSRVSISTEVKDMNIHTSRATSFLGSQSVSQLFHGPAPRRSPLLRKLSSSKGWGCKCTRSHVCVAFGRPKMSVWGWCTEPDAQSRMHFNIRTLFWYFVFDPLFSVSIFCFNSINCVSPAHSVPDFEVAVLVRDDITLVRQHVVEPPLIEDVFVGCTRFLRIYIHCISSSISSGSGSQKV